MSRTPHILIVEDDREIATLVSRFLRHNDFRCRSVSNGREMDAALRDGRFDLIVLDLMLPGEDGLSLCRRLRNDGAIPIIMLTAKGEDIDRILGLEMGADDYLVKPFNPRELLARIRAVLRRVGGTAPPELSESTVLTFAGWRLDKAVRRLLNPLGERVALTGAELDLLLAFCERPRRVLSRDQLLDLTQGRAAAPFERSIDVLVSRLRQKMEPNPRAPELIQTIRSGGYMFSPEIQSSSQAEPAPQVAQG